MAEYIFFPFYDFIVQYFPKSWVPNKVTLTGIFFTLTSSLLLLMSMPAGTAFTPGQSLLLPTSLTSDTVVPSPLSPQVMTPVISYVTPTALLTLCGVLNLLYCVADNTDGRLARRDKKTSVIGEYLDHGLDCVTSLLSACVAFSVLSSLANMTISVCLIASITVLCHTLHYERHIFIWGNRLASVDEAMIFFGVCLWLPIFFPEINTTHVPGELFDSIFGAGSPWAIYLRRLTVMDLVYIFYAVAQAQTIFNVVRHKASMLCRLHVIAVALNSVILLGAIGQHSTAMKEQLSSSGLARGYTFGPFTYPAIWIITCACTSSIIAHIPIMAHCAGLPRAHVAPLIGICCIWITFLLCPVGGALLAISTHVAQIIYNVWYIQTRAAERGRKKK